MSSRDVVILSAVRTPIGKYGRSVRVLRVLRGAETGFASEDGL